jgi:hypothetical protein
MLRNESSPLTFDRYADWSYTLKIKVSSLILVYRYLSVIPVK